MFSLFLDAKYVEYGMLTVKLDMDLCPNDTLEFEIADSFSTLQNLGIYHGQLGSSDLNFNLREFIGRYLEFRIIFRAKSNDSFNFGGVSVQSLQILAS